MDIITCKNCGYQCLPGEAVYCASCGAELPTEVSTLDTPSPKKKVSRPAPTPRRNQVDDYVSDVFRSKYFRNTITIFFLFICLIPTVICLCLSFLGFIPLSSIFGLFLQN